ncbi:CorA family divalent cation transporter [Clostridium boliviensis]|nr:CorA family divalent cation transporter [Clostridium boliviensis]
MKFLTSITIVMAIHTMISSFFGMNVGLPLHTQFSFWIIIAASMVLCGIIGYMLYKKNLF